MGKLSSSRQMHTTPLNKWRLFVVCYVFFGSVVATNVHQPILYFLQDADPDSSPMELSKNSGRFILTLSLINAASGLVWGSLSDRLGRLPVLTLSLVALTTRSVFLGFSTSFKWMILSVIIGGSFNCGYSVVRTMLAETTDASNQARAFSWLSVTFSAGMLFGPMIGGGLAHVADRAHHAAGFLGLLQQYPYLAPYLVSAAITGTGCLLALFSLRNHKSMYNNSRSREETVIESERKPLLSDEEDQSFTVSSAASILSLSDEEGQSTAVSTTSKPLSSSANSRANPRLPWKEVARACWGPVVAHGVRTAIFFSGTALFVLWASTPRSHHGLRKAPHEVGVLLAIGGLVRCLTQMLFYAPMQFRMGALRVYRFALLLVLPILFLSPLMNLISGTTILLWIFLIISRTIFSFAGSIGDTSAMLIISNAARPTGAIGTVNGVASCAGSLSNALATLVITSVWSWSIGEDRAFPLNYTLAWNILAIVCFATWLLSARLPRDIPPKFLVFKR
ncbi:major facilitator superfamily domain-containing protein [Thamnocephalis sphaerospora]|uniref:Major facilitator superfamily domain-containing protein n=1 Tax=Thamnocephalis sphaerospora TaxID=78915 RepID=A0A4P9XN23_9FUNG|nr:major facilitator superfamily domain-containing protein [Thamnocephalis sphaerospora]|eukprot:RKP06700.1 major facilitator superfamily domain-containing protein [Thamnocephalis sphaerospora]